MLEDSPLTHRFLPELQLAWPGERRSSVPLRQDPSTKLNIHHTGKTLRDSICRDYACMWRPEVNPQDLSYFLPYSETQPNEPAAHRLGWSGGAAKLRAHHASASPVLAGVPWMDRTLRFTVQRLYTKPPESSPQIIRVIPCGREMALQDSSRGSYRHLSLTQQRYSCLGVLPCDRHSEP